MDYLIRNRRSEFESPVMRGLLIERLGYACDHEDLTCKAQWATCMQYREYRKSVDAKDLSESV
jgi:hypothetical protein